MFDLEVLVPVSAKYPSRVEDFKKYGLVNCGERKVLVNVLVSGDPIAGVELGWPKGVKIEVTHGSSSGYVPNVYRFYTNINPDNPKARWFMRIDDDSCTDIDGLLSNLDSTYDWQLPFYLGDLVLFKEPIKFKEKSAFEKYKHLLGHLQHICGELNTEVECGIMSAAALSKVLNDFSARRLLEKRSEIDGGYFDCVVAIASAMAKVFPTNCPFVSRNPLIDQFSLLGGFKNHIHQVCRVKVGENLNQRCSHEGFMLLVKAIENRPSSIEQHLLGKKGTLHLGGGKKIALEFESLYKGNIHNLKKKCNWFELNGELIVLCENKVLNRFPIKGIKLFGESLSEYPIF